MSNLEEIIHEVNRFITFKETRETYMEDLRNIVEYFIKKLKETDEVFEKLYNGDYLQGSYADNLKITEPDEYDIVIHMELPETNLADIQRDPGKPGYVNININKILNKMLWYKDINSSVTIHNEVYKYLTKHSDTNGFLLQNEILSWFESRMTKVISKINTKVTSVNGKKFTQLSLKGRVYNFRYTKSGPAHTLSVYPEHLNGKKISIDLVPCFKFTESQWVAPVKFTGDGYVTDWVAVPKPDKNCPGQDNISFISSFCDTERGIIKNKNQLKNNIRILKKIRDKWGLENLKSYYIKTAFLWKDNEQKKEFWNQSSTKIFKIMLDSLIDHLNDRNLPFFWDESQNMFDDLSIYQIKDMANKLSSIKRDITSLRPKEKIYKIFLTEEEINSMDSGETLEEKLIQEKKEEGFFPTLINIGGVVGGVAIAAAAGYGLYQLCRNWFINDNNNENNNNNRKGRAPRQ